MSDDAQVDAGALDTIKEIKVWAHSAGDHAERLLKIMFGNDD